MKKNLKILLILTLSVLSILFATAEPLQMNGEEPSSWHIWLMGILLIVIVILIQLSFKSMTTYKEDEMSFPFKAFTFGLIILGIDQVFLVADHLGYLNFNMTLDHLANIIGFIIIGIGLYAFSRTKKSNY